MTWEYAKTEKVRRSFYLDIEVDVDLTEKIPLSKYSQFVNDAIAERLKGLPLLKDREKPKKKK